VSNALAIAAVTESLVALLSDHLPAAQVNNAHVSAVTPDQTLGRANPGVNVFLYQVCPNAALRNADLPTRALDGTMLQKPQAALDLHYLFTFYGDDTLLEQQRMLGVVALTLHRFPNLQRNWVQPVPITTSTTAPSNLQNQTQLVRFTPISFSLEELSKLWSFLLKVDYVLSAAYVASVVLIEADDDVPAPPALPALSYRVRALPRRQLTITQVVAASDPNAPITMATDIAILGTNLTAPSGGSTQVLIGGINTPPGSISTNRITVALPNGLMIGPQTAQVLQPLRLGSPPVSHPGTGDTSNLAAFILNPMIATSSPGGFAITLVPNFGSPPGPAIQVTLVPQVQAGQRAVLQLFPQATPTTFQLFDGGTLTSATDTLDFPIGGLAHGTYIVRVLVDGAETPLVLGAGGVPVGPLVTV
jgi:hypothetical protein